MTTPSELAAQIFAALATQTQTLIDQLNARDYAGATGTANSLLGNINAGAATMRHEAAVMAQAITEEAQAFVARVKDLEETGRPDAPTDPNAPGIDQPDGGVGDPAPKTDPNAPVFENDSTYEEDVDEDGKAVDHHKSSKKK